MVGSGDGGCQGVVWWASGGWESGGWWGWDDGVGWCFHVPFDRLVAKTLAASLIYFSILFQILFEKFKKMGDNNRGKNML